MTWDTISSGDLCRLLADRYEEEWGVTEGRCACGRPARKKFCRACAHVDVLNKNRIRRLKKVAA